jgi:hypothetical protein
MLLNGAASQIGTSIKIVVLGNIEAGRMSDENIVYSGEIERSLFC